MKRREVELVAGLAAAIGVATVGVLLFRDDEASLSRGARLASDLTRADSVSATEPAVAWQTNQLQAGESSSEPGSPRIADASREVEPVPEVDFLGLILLRSPPPDAPAEEGTLILRNADPAGPSLPIEIAVKEGRFKGRGPVNAEVEVERLVLSGHEIATSERTWKLAKRWIEIEGVWKRGTLLHVVDAGDRRELTNVTLRTSAHIEGGTESASGGLLIAEAKRSTRFGGYDSPIRVGGNSAIRFAVIHAPDHGDEWIFLEPDDVERTVALHTPAAARVQVEPWPPIVRDASGSPVETERRIVVAYVDDDADGNDPDEVANSNADETMLASLKPSQWPAAKAELVRGRLRAAASRSPFRHVAAIDESGAALFEDLCAARWIAWIEETGGGDHEPIRIVINGAVVTDFNRGYGAPSCAFAEFWTTSGRQSDVVLRDDARATRMCTLTVHAVDATDHAPIDLESDEIHAYALDPPSRKSAGDVRRKPQDSAEVSGGGSAGVFEVPVGFTSVGIEPLRHPRYRFKSTLVELVPGANEIEVALPRFEGVVVNVDVSRDAFKSDVNYSALLKSIHLLRDGRDFESCIGSFRIQSCVTIRFSPLTAGTYQLQVPDHAGFDRSGTIPVVVRDGDATIVELRWLPPDAAKGESGD